MAKKKTDDGLRVGLIIQLDFEKDGTLKEFFTDLAADEVEAAGRLVPQLLSVARGGGVVASNDRNSPRLADQVTKYLEALERSAGIRQRAWR